MKLAFLHRATARRPPALLSVQARSFRASQVLNVAGDLYSKNARVADRV